MFLQGNLFHGTLAPDGVSTSISPDSTEKFPDGSTSTLNQLLQAAVTFGLPHQGLAGQETGIGTGLHNAGRDFPTACAGLISLTRQAPFWRRASPKRAIRLSVVARSAA